MPMSLPKLAVLLSATALLLGCAQGGPPGQAAQALPPGLAAPQDLVRWRQARFVLLGEVHDNAEQHRQRALLLSALLSDGRPTRVLFEQMDREYNPAIAAAPRDADAIATAGRLNRPAWQWPLHRPLLEAALAAGAEVGGANLSRTAAGAIVRGGLAAAPADVQPLLARSDWTPALQAVMEREIDTGHCGALPASQWGPMVLAQRARDAAMAATLLQAPDRTRVVLIAGNGHVRTDLGVPKLLREAGVPPRDILAIGFFEQGDPGLPVDVVRHTPASPRGDPCEAFRR